MYFCWILFFLLTLLLLGLCSGWLLFAIFYVKAFFWLILFWISTWVFPLNFLSFIFPIIKASWTIPEFLSTLSHNYHSKFVIGKLWHIDWISAPRSDRSSLLGDLTVTADEQSIATSFASHFSFFFFNLKFKIIQHVHYKLFLTFAHICSI